jgi:hypothetical protein
MAVRANHALTTGSGRTVTAAAAAGMIPVRAWHRMRTRSADRPEDRRSQRRLRLGVSGGLAVAGVGAAAAPVGLG